MAQSAMDKARTHRAKQDLHSERDRLLKHADRRVDKQTLMPDDGKDRARALIWTTVLLIGPAVAYPTVILGWFFIFHDSIIKFGVLLVSLLAISMTLALFSFRWAAGKERPWLWWLGFFTGQATLMALVVGFFLYYRQLVYYWKYEEMRAYTNVAAAQDDKGFADASMILFTEDTRLDMQRAVGYKSKWTGTVYCVAPIVDMTMSSVAPIYYWAIGEGCCDARSDFHCGDSHDTSTRSGLVALEPDDIVRPFMKWAVKGSPYSRYLKAVNLEEATYVTKAAENPTFVYWSRDPIALKDSFYSEAASQCVTVSLIYFAVLAVVVYVAAWRILPKKKLEGVLRYAQ